MTANDAFSSTFQTCSVVRTGPAAVRASGLSMVVDTELTSGAFNP
jgi:hypothetical protein